MRKKLSIIGLSTFAYLSPIVAFANPSVNPHEPVVDSSSKQSLSNDPSEPKTLVPQKQKVMPIHFSMDKIRKADLSRGYHTSGLNYEFVVLIKSEEKQDQRKEYILNSLGDYGLASLENGPVNKRNHVLVQEDYVWILRKSSKRPTAVSLRERLTGLASIGDIMSTYFSRNYEISKHEVLKQGTSKFDYLEMKATSQFATYEIVKLWLNQDTGLLDRAEYLSPGRTILKAITMKYDQSLKIEDKTVPFISSMEFREGSNTAATAIVTYGEPKQVDLSKDYFELESVFKRINDEP